MLQAYELTDLELKFLCIILNFFYHFCLPLQVPLLRELYSNVQRHKDQTTGQRYSRNDSSPRSNRAGEISMEGYMEKLPMGRRRASLIKKWKKRYFRAKNGNLFYYEVRKKGPHQVFLLLIFFFFSCNVTSSKIWKNVPV